MGVLPGWCVTSLRVCDSGLGSASASISASPHPTASYWIDKNESVPLGSKMPSLADKPDHLDLALGGRRQDDHEFKTGLGHTAELLLVRGSFCLNGSINLALQTVDNSSKVCGTGLYLDLVQVDQ